MAGPPSESVRDVRRGIFHQKTRHLANRFAERRAEHRATPPPVGRSGALPGGGRERSVKTVRGTGDGRRGQARVTATYSIAIPAAITPSIHRMLANIFLP